MSVKEILSAKGAEVTTARPDITVETAAHVMRSGGIGAVVISKDGDSLDGLITERDIVNGLVQHGAAVMSMTVEDIMQNYPATCAPDESIDTVMAEMTRRRTRHVIVVEAGTIQGIVSIGDVVKRRMDELQLEVDALRTRYAATH